MCLKCFSIFRKCSLFACWLLIAICSGFHLTKQWIKASHTLVLVITFFLFLLRVDSVHSHFRQCISHMVYLPLPQSQEWLLYHNMQHRSPWMRFTSFPSAADGILKWQWRLLGFLVWFGDSGRQLWQPFKPTCHCEKAPEMCLKVTGLLWSFQKWCKKVKSNQKWASNEALKMSNFYQTEQWWRHSQSMIIN